MPRRFPRIPKKIRFNWDTGNTDRNGCGTLAVGNEGEKTVGLRDLERLDDRASAQLTQVIVFSVLRVRVSL